MMNSSPISSIVGTMNAVAVGLGAMQLMRIRRVSARASARCIVHTLMHSFENE